MIERVTVVKFGVNQGGANDTSSFKVKVRALVSLVSTTKLHTAFLPTETTSPRSAVDFSIRMNADLIQKGSAAIFVNGHGCCQQQLSISPSLR